MPATTEQDRRTAELLEAVIDLDRDERAAYLKAHCDDPALAARILRMADDEDAAASPLDEPLLKGLDVDLETLARDAAAADATPEPERRTIGHYELEQVLGEGGMGRVYLARQEIPIRRQVALKIMRHGLGSDGDQARFDAERQSLARLSHPNIAQVYEAGATRDGKPWFAMELVRGVPVTRYCDEQRLGVVKRLHIFLDALMGVQHAHQNQLLHRDLKPSNILVTEVDGLPMVKIIDFGISLGLDGDSGRTSQRGQRAGTPGYSPPESLMDDEDGAHLDTRSDIYTLGVALYELLCGVRPFDRPGDTPKDVWRRIREDTPMTPARQIAGMEREKAHDIAESRSTRPRRLVKQLDGDLGAIVMKAISREPDARYGSVNAFFRDIERYLDREPVEARDQDFTYVAGLFIHRHLGPVLFASLLLAVLAGGLMAWSEEAYLAGEAAKRANREAVLAREALAESEQMSAFLVELFELTGAQSGQPERMTTRELLDLGAENLASRDDMAPLDRARMLQLLGEIYTEVYALDQAESMVRKALEIRRAELGPGDPAVADSLGQLGDIYRIQMRYEDAEPVLLEAVDAARQSDPANPAAVALAWSRLGDLYWMQDRLDEAIDAHERALEIREVELDGQDAPALAESVNNLGIMLQARGRHAEAEPYLSDAVRLYRDVLGDEDLRTAAAVNNLAITREHLGKLDDAEASYLEAIAMWRAIDGRTHPRPMLAMESLVRSLGRWGRFDKGVEVGREALADRESAHGDRDPEIVPALIALGINEARAGQQAAAMDHLQRALDISQSAFGPGHQRTLAARDAMAWYTWQRGDFVEALDRQQRILDLRLAQLGETHALTAFSRHNTALALASLGRLEAAEALMRQALSTWEQARGQDHRTTAHSLHYLGLITWNLGQTEEADTLLQRALDIRRRLYPEDHPDVQRSRNALEGLRGFEPPFPVTPGN